MKQPCAFRQPIYITRPSLPRLDDFACSLQTIWHSRRLTNNGPLVRELEERLRLHVGSQYLTLFANGTLALMLAYKSLGLAGEVITTPFTFPATLHALTWNGITPVFCDIRPDDFTLNAELLPELITPATSGIVPVHVFDSLCQFDKIEAVAKEYDLKVLYDAAHAFGVSTMGRSVATFGDITMFSLHATKIFHTIEGGILAYDDVQLDHALRLWRNFGFHDAEHILLPGINAKLNEFQALVGLMLLDQFEIQRQCRAERMALYAHRLGRLPGIRHLCAPPWVKSNYAYNVIQIDAQQAGITRDELHEKLMHYNIVTRNYFDPLCSRYIHYRELSSARPERLPIAERVAQEVLTLPLYAELEHETIMRICDIIEYILVTHHSRNEIGKK